MIRFKAILILSFLLVWKTVSGQSQGPSVINAAGANTSGDQYSHSFSIGEIVITTLTGTENQVTQGYLQPEILPGPDKFDYYPNPVDDKLFLINAQQVKAIRIFDLNGRLIFEGKYLNEPIVLDRLSGGTYLVNTLNGENKIIHKFTIIKQ